SALNLFGDVVYRIRGSHVPQKIETRAGLYYDFHWDLWVLRVFTPHIAYKFLNSFGGSGVFGDGTDIVYAHDVRERAHLLESGLGVTDKGGRRYQFYFDWGFAGENTPAVMTYGLSATFPIGK